MKKIIIFLLINLFVINSFALAAPDKPDIPIVTTNKTIWDLINKAITWFLYFLIIVAVTMIIYTGFLYVNSGGDSKQVKTAFESLKYIIIGIIVLLLSWSIINFIQNFFGVNIGNNTTNTTVQQDTQTVQTNDELKNVSFSELIQESWFQYRDPNCNLNNNNCCKCCKQGKQNDECGRNNAYAI